MGGRTSNNLIEYKGQKKTVYAWAKELGIPKTTIEGRLAKGLPIEEALKQKTEATTTGQRIKENVRFSFDKIWRQVGKKKFEEALTQAFEEDAIKVVKDFIAYLPKDSVTEDKVKNEKAVVRIEFKQPDPTTITVNAIDVDKGDNA